MSTVLLQEQGREAVQAWLEAFHNCTDSFDAAGLDKFYTKDVTMNYANAPKFVGWESIREFFTASLTALHSMKHTIKYFDVVGDKIYQACEITYIAANDPAKLEITIPAFGVFHLLDAEGYREEKNRATGDERVPIIKHFDGYMDPGVLFARVGEVAKLLEGEGGKEGEGEK